jgi:hypothetical protein
MSTVYLVHGFNVKDGGDASVGRLRGSLASYGHKVIPIKYGWMHRLRVRMCTVGVAKTFASMVEPGASVIAHSNGANIVHAAAVAGAVFENVFLINPALDADMDIPHARFIHVFYAKSDPWTRLARWIPFSNWGRQGQVGFTGDDSRYSSTDLDTLTGTKNGHSGIFSTKRGRSWLVQMIRGGLYER